ncbi:MAG: hypothetical protein E7006_04725 [Alphaproteobacteria bacterium]|nr:hypothetical protein [Alphaproteobacteria bacterium]
MIKKLISLVCCLLPVGAVADVLQPVGGAPTVSTSQFPTDGSAVIIGGGNGINAPGGLSVANNMYVGAATDMGAINGSLVVLNTATSPFAVLAGGNVSVGSMLRVLDGWNFGIQTTGTGWDVDLGSLDNLGTFTTQNINTFTSGQVVNGGMLDIVANDKVDMGALTANGSGTTKIVANENGIAVAGTVQNNAGLMSLTATGDVNSVNIMGSLENTGTGLVVDAGDLTVGGTMKNDSQSGSVKLTVGNWYVNGGTTDSYSFVNNGVVNAVVSGATSFAHGMNLSGMDVANKFYLKTHTLDLGTNAELANSLNDMDIIVTGGGLTLDGIANQTNGDLGANMTLDIARHLAALSVVNQGQDLIIDTGTMTINNAVTSVTGSNTVLMASGASVDNQPTLNIKGALSNAGNMTINGQYVQVASAVNQGANMTITSLTSDSGKIVIAGDVTNNSGDTTIWARDVSVGGVLLNNGGTINLYASDTDQGAVQIGTLSAVAGVTNLNALAGNVSVGGNVTVSQAVDNTGALNVLGSVHNMNVGGNVRVHGDFNASSTAATGNGDMTVMAVETAGIKLTADSILIDGDVNVTDASNVRNVTMSAPLIYVGQNVNVAGKGYLNMGDTATAYVDITDALGIATGGVFESSANDFIVGNMNLSGKFIMHGRSIVADTGDIYINGGVYFDPENDVSNPSSGLVLRDGVVGSLDEFLLQTTTEDAAISMGGVTVGDNRTLKVVSAAEISVGGSVVNNGNLDIDASENVYMGGITRNNGVLDVVGTSVEMANVINTNQMSINAQQDAVALGVVKTDVLLDITAGTSITAQSFNQTSGLMNLRANTIETDGFVVSGNGSAANVTANSFDVNGNLRVDGDLVHAGNGGMLNISAENVGADYITTGGDFIVMGGKSQYDIMYNLNVGGNLIVQDGADILFNGVNQVVVADTLSNSGALSVVAKHGIVANQFVNTNGNVNLDAGDGAIDFGSLQLGNGTLTVDGAEMFVDSGISTGAMLYQGYVGDLKSKDINVLADNFEITTDKLVVNGINQNGSLIVNTSNVDVSGDVVASDLRLVASKDELGNTVWQNVSINGNLSGDVDFVGLEKLTVTNGNYSFGNGSQINAAILPFADGVALNTTDINYWASVNLTPGATFGQIINPTDSAARALILVDGVFVGGTEYVPEGALELGQKQIGITLFDAVDQGSAIWFLHADGGVQNVDSITLLRNLDVRFCNADGSICYDYLDSLDGKNESGDDLPAYVSVRDVNNDGVANDLYIVFDPQFGGPVLLNNLKIQQIVGRTDGATRGEYVAAGALDDMIAGQLKYTQFYNDTPLEVLPLIFKDTNLSTVANELYLRLEEYNKNFDGNPLARFSRLFQVRELEQVLGGMVLNEHTFARSFEDRMLDEFIWNRNRSLKKAWVDMDYGMFYQNVSDGKHSDGNRFALSAGFDWQQSDTLILGLTGRVSHSSSDVSDAMDLGYMAGQSVAGNVHVDVTDTDVGFGAYLMQTLGESFRLYGNAFIDVHVFDIDRMQNFVSSIEGDGTAFSLISEWGLMHDILNQYIVGNLYARIGYNFGFDITEKVDGKDYMNLESDGYLMLTPGYSLTAQKRIYPSAWFQIRPYATVGVEYDVFGAPDNAQYRFAVADRFTKYDVDIDPLWANIGGGVELISATGIQVGFDYRYQYNDALQLHNIKVSGSYRF